MGRTVIDILTESVGSLHMQLAQAIAFNDTLREQNVLLAEQVMNKNKEIQVLNDNLSKRNYINPIVDDSMVSKPESEAAN